MIEAEPMVNNGQIKIERFVLGAFSTNAYVITCQQTGESALIDAPAEPGKLIKHLETTSPQYILLTHAHPDHIGALKDVKQQLQLPLASHEAEVQNLPFAPDIYRVEGSSVAFGEMQIEVMHTPGHTPGSLCFLLGSYLLAGDTLFPGGPGKTFSPEGFKQILSSISQKIFRLPDETTVFPGHGESTTLKKEKEEYKIFSSREQPSNLYGDVVWLSS